MTYLAIASYFIWFYYYQLRANQCFKKWLFPPAGFGHTTAARTHPRIVQLTVSVHARAPRSELSSDGAVDGAHCGDPQMLNDARLAAEQRRYVVALLQPSPAESH
jgi:hypothetical protein